MNGMSDVSGLDKLNLGCGKRKRQGFINVDSNPDCSPDVLLDLDKGLSAFADNSVGEIWVEHVLEHVNDLMHLLEEMYRVSAPGAVWNVFVPHYSYGFVHPFHRRGFSVKTFDWFFAPSGAERYGHLDLTVCSVRLNYMRNCSKRGRLLVQPINWLANLHQRFCERIWCYWVGGFEEVHYTIQVNKSHGSDVQ